jgi:hypothetical protein
MEPLPLPGRPAARPVEGEERAVNGDRTNPILSEAA